MRPHFESLPSQGNAASNGNPHAVTIVCDLRFSQTSQFVISITNGRDVGHLP
jgi:hypothetical protein